MLAQLTYTPIYAALLAILVILLGARVIKFRRKEKVGLGHEKGSTAMVCAVRAHANAVENIPLALVLLLMLELNQLQPWLLHVLGLMLLVGRVLHAWGMSSFGGVSFGRFYGMVLTWLSILAMVLINLLVVLTR